MVNPRINHTHTDNSVKLTIATTLTLLTLGFALAAVPATQAAPPQFDFSLSLNGIIRLAPLGQNAELARASPTASGSVIVGVTLISGNAQTVHLSCSGGLPAGAACAFTQSSGVPTYTSRLTVETAPETDGGTYTVSVTGTSEGGVTRTIPLSVIVREQGVVIVGGTVIPVNALLVLAPYLVLALAVAGSAVYLLRSRKMQKMQ